MIPTSEREREREHVPARTGIFIILGCLAFAAILIVLALVSPYLPGVP